MVVLIMKFSFSKIDPWFLSKLRNIVNAEDQLLKYENINQLEPNFFFQIKTTWIL